MNKENTFISIAKKIFAPFGDRRFFIIAGLALVIFYGTTLVAHADAVDDISAIYSPIIDLVKNIIFMLIAGAGYVFVTSHLLQWILIHPSWVNVTTHGSNPSPLVTAGLQFTTAFADMLLIIVFLAIALGFIFKIETFQSKKALPKFFIVAILAQFAPVFVGMIIDVSTVINNTLILGSQTTIISSFDLLVSSMVQSIESLAGLIIADAAGTVMPPPIDSITEVVSIGYFLTAILPMIPVYLSQFAVAFLIGGILLTYIIFFMSRIFILQFIAIVSPLVVVAYALPQTKHFFDTVFNELLKWTFVGTLVLFLLIIGLRSSTSIMPESTDFYTLGYGIPFMLQGYIAYYLFLFVFMSVIAYIVDKNMPQMGAHMKSSFASLGGMMMASAIKPTFNGANKMMAQRQEARQRAVDEAGGKEALTPLERASFATGSALTGAMNYATGFVNKPSIKGPVKPAVPRLADAVDEQSKKIKEGDSPVADIRRLGIEKASDMRKLKGDAGVALFKKYANDQDKLKEIEKNLGSADYQSVVTSLAADKLISKDTLAKAMGSPLSRAVDEKSINEMINSKGIIETMVPKGTEDEAYKQMEAAGYHGHEAMEMAAKKGIMGALTKDPKKLKDNEIGKLITKDEGMMAAFGMTAGNNKQLLGNGLSVMDPEQQDAFKQWKDKQNVVWVAANAPELLKTTRGEKFAGLGAHPGVPTILRGKGAGKPISGIELQKFILEAGRQYKSLGNEGYDTINDLASGARGGGMGTGGPGTTNQSNRSYHQPRGPQGPPDI